jgi:hypothetical protein
MFENLKNAFLQDRETQRQKNAAFIENGYSNDSTRNDNGLKHYSTPKRWEQYQNGEISREKAVEYAIKRMNKEIDKDTEKGLARLDRVAAAPDLVFINVNVIYKRNNHWGYNPTAETQTNNGFTIGYASGCGYDKESAAVAESFNKNDSILKVLYTIKENGLASHDNRNICGYGSGYSVIPYFEGGVGVSSFWHILKKAGFVTTCHYGKHENYYSVNRVEK